MSIINETMYCNDCKTDTFMWQSTNGTYQCDACWDDWTELTFGYRQYETNKE